jgi:hypothetical protein
MRKISITMLAALCMITMVSCQSASPKRKACDDACVANKTGCYDRAKDKKGQIDAKKKTKCDVDSKACSNDCARKFK